MPTVRRATTAHKTTAKTKAATTPKATAHKTATAKAKPKADAFHAKPHRKTVAQTEAAAAVKPAHVYPADPKTPPSLSGKITMDGGQLAIETAAGKFNIVNRSDNGDSLHFFSGVDVQAFVGRVATVRGWPTDGWVPGQPGATLAVEEFAPGKDPDFVSGRVMVSGNDVLINVRSDKQVKVDDPALAAALRSYDNLGIVLPGPVEKKGEVWHFTGKPKDYYVLAGFSATYGTEQRVGNNVNFNMQLAHGKTLQCTVASTHWDKGNRQQRHYFYGHIDGAKFEAKGFTPSAGPWVTGGTPASPNPAFRTAVQKVAGKDPGAGSFEL